MSFTLRDLWLFSVIFLLCLGCSSIQSKSFSEKGLKFYSDSTHHTWLGISELKKNFKEESLMIANNPAYNGALKKYIGFSFKAILKKTYPDLDFKKVFWVEVTTLDGWTAPLYSSKTLLKGGALLAIREDRKTITKPKTKDGLWTLVKGPKGYLSPGPFYLVWNDQGKNPDIMPLQVASIRLLKNRKK